jgi:activator of 2-hydroxyglutaryl-CoA dehydratase
MMYLSDGKRRCSRYHQTRSRRERPSGTLQFEKAIRKFQRRNTSMAVTYYLGVDGGTTRTKAVVGDDAGGSVLEPDSKPSRDETGFPSARE